MEDEGNHDNLKPGDFEMSKNNPQEGSAKSFRGVDQSEKAKLKTIDGAQGSEQSPDPKHGSKDRDDYTQTLAGLSTIPNQVFEIVNLRFLNLSKNAITSIPTDIIKLTSLQELNLSYNKLSDLPETFIQSQNLKILNISHNIFSSVPIALYKSAPCLRVLDISNNALTMFPEAPLCQNHLESLFLSSNQFDTIPRWIFDVTSLRFLDLYNNAFSNMASNFLQEDFVVHISDSIKVLNLQNCQLTSDKLTFVSTILGLEALSLSNTLDVDEVHKNSLQFLDPYFLNRAKGLMYLHASNVDLLFLHSNFDSLENIRYLDLSNNSLLWLPNTFPNLVNLTECNLNSNSISQLPVEFGKLINLKKIFLSENNLVGLPASFAELKNLEVCDLYGNKLEYLDTRIMRTVGLKCIDIEDNCLDLCALWGEDFERFKERYEPLKHRFREDYCHIWGLQRRSGQKPRRSATEMAETSPKKIPDFIADYPSCAVYPLNAEIPPETWGEYPPSDVRSKND